MSEVKKDEYVEISLTQMLVSLFENIKTFLIVLVLTVVFSFSYIFTYQNKHTYEQNLRLQFYVKGGSLNQILQTDSLKFILNNILKTQQQLNPENKILNSTTILTPTVDNGNKKSKKEKRKYFALSTNADFKNKDKIIKTYDFLIKEFADSKLPHEKIKLWQQNISQQMKLNEMNISKYKMLIKESDASLNKLYSKKGMASLDGQSLLFAYMGKINNYQSQIFSLEQSQAKLKLQLKSLNTNVSKFGNLTYDKNSKQNMYLAAASMLSVFLALFAVFAKVIFQKFMVEFRKSKD